MQGNQGWLPLWDAIEGVPEHQMTTEFCFYPEPSYFISLGAPDSFSPTPSRHTHTHQVAGGKLWNILSFFAEETGDTKLVGGNVASQSHTRDSNSGSKFPAQCPLHPSPPRRGVLPLGGRDSDPPANIGDPGSHLPQKNQGRIFIWPCPTPALKSPPQVFPTLASPLLAVGFGQVTKQHKPQFPHL